MKKRKRRNHSPGCKAKVALPAMRGDRHRHGDFQFPGCDRTRHLQGANRRYGLGITANTVDCFWDGERIDLHMAVDGLIRCDDDPINEY